MKKRNNYSDNRYEDDTQEMSKDAYRGRRDPKKNKKRDSDRKDKKADHWN